MNHKSAQEFSKAIDEYLDKEIALEAILGLFEYSRWRDAMCRR